MSENDYYPYGMVIPGRRYTNGTEYRYGFNDKEKDNEIKGEGNQQDYGMRIFDPRLGRFLSVDPLTSKYPWYTPYQFAGNDVIRNIDLDGAEPQQAGKTCDEYAIAPVEKSKDKSSYGWTWDSDIKKWARGSSTKFKNGITTNEEAKVKDTDGDLKSSDNPPAPNLYS